MHCTLWVNATRNAHVRIKKNKANIAPQHVSICMPRARLPASTLCAEVEAQTFCLERHKQIGLLVPCAQSQTTGQYDTVRQAQTALTIRLKRQRCSGTSPSRSPTQMPSREPRRVSFGDIATYVVEWLAPRVSTHWIVPSKQADLAPASAYGRSSPIY